MSLIESIPRILEARRRINQAFREFYATDGVTAAEFSAAMVLVMKDHAAEDRLISRLVDAVEFERELAQERTRSHPTSSPELQEKFRQGRAGTILPHLSMDRDGVLSANTEEMEHLRQHSPDTYEDLMRVAEKVNAFRADVRRQSGVK